MRRGAAALRRIKVSQGGRRSSWPGRWEAVCRDSCIWRWWECAGVWYVCIYVCMYVCPQEFLGWELWALGSESGSGEWGEWEWA